MFFSRDAIFPYLDEETQDAVFYYQDEQHQQDESIETVPTLTLKMEKEITHLFNQKFSTELMGLMETLNKLASHILELSDNETYGVKGARVILKLRTLNGVEQTVGSFVLDPNTVSRLEFKNCTFTYQLISFTDQYL